MSTTLRIPKVKLSPSTTQYAKPEFQPRPFYTPRFKMDKAVVEKDIGGWLSYTDPLMPAYPFGRNNHFREANFGLYGGTTIQSGNKISKGRNKGKTVRKWFPNVRMETIRSEALGRDLTIPITARTLRTIKKCGGLDEYLLGEKPARIKELGMLGWKLRWNVLQSPAMQGKHAEERKKLGLQTGSPLTESFSEVWSDSRRRQELLDQQETAWHKLREKAERVDRLAKEMMRDISGQRTYIPGSLATLMKYSPKGMTLPDLVREVELEALSWEIRHCHNCEAEIQIEKEARPIAIGEGPTEEHWCIPCRRHWEETGKKRPTGTQQDGMEIPTEELEEEKERVSS